MTRTPEQLAWVAGLYEGEGTIYTQKTTNDYMQIRLTIAMVDEDIIGRIGEIMQPYGRVASYQPKRENAKLMWSWRVTKRQDVAHVIMLLMPWLGERRKTQIGTQLDKLHGVDEV